MEEKKPCCPAAAVRKIRKIDIKGIGVGIALLDEVIEKVAALDLTNDEDIGRALLKETKIYNYVPASQEPAYRQAILEEYAKRK